MNIVVKAAIGVVIIALAATNYLSRPNSLKWPAATQSSSARSHG